MAKMMSNKPINNTIMRTTINYKGQTIIKQNSEHRFYVKRFNDPIKGGVMFTNLQRAQSYIDSHLTYDVVFNDDTDSNSKGFKSSIEDCKKYIELNNGSNESYFADYKGGIVSVVCNETGEEVYSEEVR